MNFVQVSVEPKPLPPPTMSCSVDRSSVLAGEKVNVTAKVNDQTESALTYSWLANGGEISGSGASVQLDTTGLLPSMFTITGRVENAKGGAADCSASITIQAPPPPPPAPHATKINECHFALRSARLDNVCQRLLDDAAVRLASDSKATIVLIGYASPRKGNAQRLAYKLAIARVQNARKYLGLTKGLDASRIEIAIGGSTATAGKENRRVEIFLVPEGATY